MTKQSKQKGKGSEFETFKPTSNKSGGKRMKYWFLDVPSDSYKTYGGLKTITREQFLTYKGKYDTPTDSVLDAIYVIFKSVGKELNDK